MRRQPQQAPTTFGRHMMRGPGSAKGYGSRLPKIVLCTLVLTMVVLLYLHRQSTTKKQQQDPSVDPSITQHNGDPPLIDSKLAPPKKVDDGARTLDDLVKKHEDEHRRLLDDMARGGGGGQFANEGDRSTQREGRVVDMIDKLRHDHRLRHHILDGSDAAAGNDRDAAMRPNNDGTIERMHIGEDLARRMEEQKRKFSERLSEHRKRIQDMMRSNREDIHPFAADSIHPLKPALDDKDPHPMNGRDDAIHGNNNIHANKARLEHLAINELRNTAFGRTIDNVRQQQRHRDEMMMMEGNHHPANHDNNAPPSSQPLLLSIALFTTLKSCDNETIKYAQLDAVSSWVSLPAHPALVVVLMGGDVECSKWVAKEVNKRHDEVFGQSGEEVVRVAMDVDMGRGGTVLLGSAIARLRREVPTANIYGLINADILLEPIASVGLHRVAGQYKEYFIVGHRKTVRIPLSRRASYHRDQQHSGSDGGGDPSVVAHGGGGARLDFFSTAWAYHGDALLESAVADRVDAEDFFFWSAGYFDRSTEDGGVRTPHRAPPTSPEGVTIPNFHIGRPAYDNWLVHHAIHTWKPVVDASELLVAYHQSHDYGHLSAAGGAGGETKQKSYWGGDEQRENYDMGVAAGGWQHGTMDMVPLAFGPAGCAQIVRREAATQGKYRLGDDNGGNVKRLFDWFAYTVEKAHQEGHRHQHRGSRECGLGLRLGWRPFADNVPTTLQTETDYMSQYDSYQTAA